MPFVVDSSPRFSSTSTPSIPGTGILTLGRQTVVIIPPRAPPKCRSQNTSNLTSVRSAAVEVNGTLLPAVRTLRGTHPRRHRARPSHRRIRRETPTSPLRRGAITTARVGSSVHPSRRASHPAPCRAHLDAAPTGDPGVGAGRRVGVDARADRAFTPRGVSRDVRADRRGRRAIRARAGAPGAHHVHGTQRTPRAIAKRTAPVG